jgi:hypothetical protein
MTAVSDALLDGKRIRAAERRARAIGEITGALARSMKRRGLVTGRPATTGFRSHIATGLDRRSWLEWKQRQHGLAVLASPCPRTFAAAKLFGQPQYACTFCEFIRDCPRHTDLEDHAEPKSRLQLEQSLHNRPCFLLAPG